MTDDIKLAQQAGISFSTYQVIGGRLTTLTDGSQKIERIEAFAALIRADERERCAKKIESTAKYFVDKPKAIHIVSIETRKLQADELRAMEDKE